MSEKEFVSATINGSIEELDCFVTIKGQKVPCSREVYLTIKRPGRKENKRQQRAKRPFINGKRCKGDCSHCDCFDGVKCSKTGDVSLDELPEDGNSTPVASQDVEAEAIVKVTICNMENELLGESEQCIKIFHLMRKEYAEREIAQKLDLSPGTVSYYVKKIRKKLDKFRY